ncbi:flagellar protein FlgN [Neobacillus citreus]|uniref:Flagellar protein FlgN n=1 Tax=Neobacillus citreus TaxID=2833578 RepID=A0A942SUY9_9BACI|nr:flagellar protein FlgN [Neobacillus citreus]MCH6266835.1 flagellar protein FlgN [Neobacillus citreus]
MESLDKLTQVMVSLVDAHERLLGLAKEKQAVLIDGSGVEELQRFLYRESTLVDAIQKLEHQRLACVQEYSLRLGVKEESLTMVDLIKMQENTAVKAGLKAITEKLRVLINEISQVNNSNQQLIQTSLSYIQYSLEMLVQKQPAIGYGPNAGSRYASLLDARI